MQDPFSPPPKRIGRILALWFGAFFGVGLVLFSFGGVPLAPILAAGLVTLAVTLFRFYRKK